MPINQTKMHLTEIKYIKRGKITNIFCRKCKLKYQRDRCLNMDEIRHKNPKEFWKQFSKKHLPYKTKTN